MKYSIKELSSHSISRTLVYEVINSNITVSKQFLKNKRLFDDKDLEIFKFYKYQWLKATIEKYWIDVSQENPPQQVEEKNSFNTVSNSIKKQFKESSENFIIPQEIKREKSRFLFQKS